MSDTPETIYLIPDYDEGVLGHVWCDDPAPGIGMEPDDAIEYRRADTVEDELAAAKARIAELEKGLEPFAREASQWGSQARNDDFVKVCGQLDEDPVDSEVTVGDLRRAAALLNKEAL